MRKKQKQKAPQSALETLLLVLLAALTLVPLFLVVQNSFKSRFISPATRLHCPTKRPLWRWKLYQRPVCRRLFRRLWPVAADHRCVCGADCSLHLHGRLVSHAGTHGSDQRYVLPIRFQHDRAVSNGDVHHDLFGWPGKAEYRSWYAVYLSAGCGVSVFMLCGFIRGIPRELEEAATIDGCNPVQTFFLVVLPLLNPRR